jgi:hypothetical protein
MWYLSSFGWLRRQKLLSQKEKLKIAITYNKEIPHAWSSLIDERINGSEIKQKISLNGLNARFKLQYTVSYV